ncbi:glycoside hydrolase family 38 C-terminal domain-containing protein [Micromonospora sp. NPDC047074]|uniref:alpha-mannosidase n=1 Tax=Micromonospora sp. NPDC047074 TaxID=3154339 RepID=UPI0033C33390
MHDDRELIADRLARLLRERIRPATHRTVASLEVTAWHVEGGQGEPVPPSAALPQPGASGPDERYVPLRVGQEWGPAWGTSWLHLTGEVPAVAAGARVELRVDLGWMPGMSGFQAEGLVYRPDGSVVKGLNPYNDWIPVAAPAAGGERIDLYLEAAANPYLSDMSTFLPTPLGDRDTAGAQPLYRLVRADVTVFEAEVWELVADLEVLDGLRRELADGDPRGWEIHRALGRALDALDLADVAGTAHLARAELAEVLSRPAHASAHRLTAVGHAHIDTAWLWPQRETVRKVARTAANVVQLMDEEPDLVFAMSSAQQFAWLQEHRPEVFERVAEQVRAGRFVPVGGMWVESDTNLPGGEALARQLVRGKRYFLDTFGIDTPEVWLPDSFGYSAAMPQLVRLAGSRWFLTQKISWNQTNRFPHHTFWWEGIDGTRLFTHFPPVDTYNAELTARELAHAVANFRDKGPASRSLVPFGHGDGGGGPTREMLARARRVADLEGSPRVRVESPAAFFAAAEQEYPQAPVWVGELYLEAHRATYTSQAQTKQGNRRSEHLLREAELWSATAARAGLVDYPYDALDRIWKSVLLHQFHDILPGSSIAWVHREARDTYRRIAAELEEIIGTAVAALAGAPTGAGEDAAGGQAVVFNAGPYARDGVPALGAGQPDPSGDPVRVSRADGGFVLDNGLLRIVVDRHGLLTSVRDLAADREVLAPGLPGNLLQLHADLPNRWDAWDVDAFYRNRVTDLTGVDRLVCTAFPEADQGEQQDPIPGDRGGAESVLVFRRFGDSTVVQEIGLAPGRRRVDLRTEVDWHEREKFLKVAFPLDVHTDRAAYETQYGHVHRPTHENTSWEAAKFEVCAHRWVRVSEPDYGVALVNEATYGHDVRREARPGGGTLTTVRLSLLRAPRFPDPETDQGRHSFRYALVPGERLVDAIREGYAINLPARRAAGAAAVPPLVEVTHEGVIVEAVKLADDRSGDVVVRLYESLGGRATARLRAGFPVARVTEADLLERPIAADALRAAPSHPTRPEADGELAPDGVELSLRPFQVVTVRLVPAAG